MPPKSVWDAYTAMVEKSPTNTVIFTGVILILLALFFIFVILAFSRGLRASLRDIIKGVRYSEGKLAYDGGFKI
jgi:hypothetical protein